MSVFGRSSIALYLTRHKLYVTDSVSGKPTIRQIEWDGKSLATALKQIQSTYRAQQVTIILGNDMSYVTVTALHGKAEPDGIVRELAGVLPFEVTQKNIAYKTLIGPNAKPYIQVFAIDQTDLSLIYQALKQAGLICDAIYSSSLLLAASTTSLLTPQLITWSREESLLIVANKGYVYACEAVAGEATDGINQLLTYSKDTYQMSITEMLIDHPQSSQITAAFPGLKPTPKTFEPLTDIRVKINAGDTSLTIKPVDATLIPVVAKEPSPAETPTSGEIPQDLQQSPKPKMSKTMTILVAILLILIIVSAVYFILSTLQGQL